MRRFILTSTVVLALIGVGASVQHLLADHHYNQGFIDHPLLTKTHVAAGGLFLALALTQFSTRVRRRWPALHRAAGQATVATGLVSGVAALVMAFWFPFTGPLQTAITAPFALLFLASLVRGAWLASARRFDEHREWMIRALAVATAIASMRLIFVPLLIAFGDDQVRLFSQSSTAISFTLHVLVAELWIRRTREPADQGAAMRPAIASTEL